MAKTNSSQDNTSRKVIVWRVANGIMGLFFIVAACLQVNDPDPVVWICLYGITGAVSLSISALPSLQGNRIWRILVSAHFLCCLAMLSYVILYYGHVIQTGSQILNDEEGRELSGAVIVQLWLAIILAVSFHRENINNLSPYEWFIVSSGVIAPLFCMTVLYRNIDHAALPDHCKNILETVIRKLKNQTTR